MHYSRFLERYAPVNHGENFVTVSNRILIFSLSVFVFGISACSRSPKTAIPSGDSTKNQTVEQSSFDFRDVTALSGVNAVYQNGEDANAFSIVESLGGGVGALDFDLDSRIDLFFPGGGTIEIGSPLRGLPSSLWRNTGEAHFVEATTPAMIPTPKCYTHPTTEILKVYLKNSSETGQLGSEMQSIDEEIAKLTAEDAAKGNALKADFDAVKSAKSEAAVKSKVKEMLKKL